MRLFRAFHLLTVAALTVSCHLDRLVQSSGGGGGGGGPPPPGPPTALAFTVQPRGIMPDSAIKPPVQVTARDSAGNTATNFNGTMRVAIDSDGSALRNAKLLGDTVATAVAGVATFNGLSIDQAGTGYTLSAALATGGSMGTSAPFDVATVTPPPPTTGDLTVSAVTTGQDLDPDGYTVTVDGSQSLALGVNSSVTFSGLTAADHSVQLSGVASNCTVGGQNPRTVTVPAGATVQTIFAITCTPLPNQPPVAAFTSSCTGLTCSFTSTSSDPDGSITTYQWAFGDGGASTTQNPSHTYTANGSYTVTLTVTDNQGAQGTVSHSVTVTASNQPPTAAFTSSCTGLTCSFTSTSSDPDGSISSYAWNFGDGVTSTSQNPSHTYAQGGTFTVALTVTDNQNATNSVSHSVSVTAPNQPPVAAFTSSCTGLTCSFTSTSSDPDGSITTYQWAFGDGAASTTQNPSHTYTANGSYTVTLTVTDNQGAQGTVSHSVTVTASNQPPTAAFTSSCTGLTCSFTSTSSDPDGSISSYAWNFGDGVTSTSQNPSHTYAQGGTFTVALTVTDNQNATNSVSHSVSVTAPNQPPVAAFSSSCTGLTCSFTSTSSDPDGSVTGYQWAFGDGGASTTQNPSHTYTASGSYTVTLTVTDNQGAQGTVSHSVTVTAPNQPPTAAFTSSCTGLTCSFTSTSSDPDGSITGYQWAFGDGGASTAQNPSHTYTATNSYTVTLTVTDNQGAQGTVSHSVTVTAPNQPPVVSAGGDQHVLVGALFSLSEASFSDPNHNGPWTVTIDWGDGTSNTTSTLTSEGSIGGSHSYLTLLNASYTLTITVRDAGGLSGSASKTVSVTIL